MSTYDCCIWDGADWFTKIRYAIRTMADRSAIKDREIGRQAERLLDQYGNSVLRLAYSYLHNMSDAEEILQETLIRYLQTAPEFENSAHEKAWLMKVWQPIEGNPGGMTQVGNPMNEYSSLQELYVAYDDGIAELQYIGADMDITYRKAVGTADISGDYSEYDREETISVNDAEVLLKGDTDYDSLAIWTQGEYSYALRLNPGADRETVRRWLQAIIEAPIS